MNFNFIPTDNLYKFMAIAGLAITVLNFYYGWTELYSLQEEQIMYSQRYVEPVTMLKKRAASQKKSLDKELYNLEFERAGATAVLQQVDYAPTKHVADRIRNYVQTKREELNLIELKLIAKRAQMTELMSFADSLEATGKYAKKLVEIKTNRYVKFRGFLKWITIAAVVGCALGFLGWLRYQWAMDKQMFKTSILKLPLTKHRRSTARAFKLTGNRNHRTSEL